MWRKQKGLRLCARHHLPWPEENSNEGLSRSEAEGEPPSGERRVPKIFRLILSLRGKLAGCPFGGESCTLFYFNSVLKGKRTRGQNNGLWCCVKSLVFRLFDDCELFCDFFTSHPPHNSSRSQVGGQCPPPADSEALAGLMPTTVRRRPSWV